MKKFNRKLMIIMRVCLLCVGFAVGFLLMHLLIREYPRPSSDKYPYIYCTGSGLVLGMILMLSARSVVWLCHTVGSGIKRALVGAKPFMLAAVLVGLAFCALLTYLFDFLLSFSGIAIGLRVVLDVAFVCSSVSLCVFAALKIAQAFSGIGSEKENERTFQNGYVLTAAALRCDGIVGFCRDWLIGSIAVLDCTVALLIEGGERDCAALKAYGELVACGCVVTVSERGQNEWECVTEYARENNLRILSDTADGKDADVPVLGFCDLSVRAACLPALNGQVAREEMSAADSDCVKAIDETQKRV